MSDGTTRHSDLLRICVEYLQLRGAWVFRVHGGLGQRPGVPDILACLQGRLVAVEGKTGRARLYPSQEAERDALVAAGAVYVLVRRLEDLETALRAAGLIGDTWVWPNKQEQEGDKDA